METELSKVRPLGDRILLARDEKDATTKSGLILPQKTQVRSKRCTVLAIGPGIYDSRGELRPVVVKVGDRVTVLDYSDNEITLDGKSYWIVREEEILAILE